jgi:hypothetical protein
MQYPRWMGGGRLHRIGFRVDCRALGR